ncbi:MAG: hypothetical protein R3275_13835 [Saprospiraceae bacterium]|nr:hypothetical protein [Saprospiraceae bacterium]
MIERYYNCKVLLYGEYTVLHGSDALAVPSSAFTGRWINRSSVDEELRQFADYLIDRKDRLLHLDLQQFSWDIDRGLGFESNIPVGYGLGSSGAVTAAVFDRYAKEKEKRLEDLVVELSLMESHFHGKSSGIDPLVSYLNMPILKTDSGLRALEHIPEQITEKFWLIDSGRSRSTARLVAAFNDRLKDEKVMAVVKDHWVPLVNDAIMFHLDNDVDNLLNTLHSIQQLVWVYFQDFIPKPHMSMWHSTLEDPDAVVKLCGAGGGGMTLGFGRKPVEIDYLEVW